MPQDSPSQNRVPLQDAARELGLTGHGLLKILKRVNAAVREDGRWYVLVEKLAAIAAARRTLGIDRAPKTKESVAA